MADFNPEFTTPDKSYLNYSKPISQPESDKSTGIALHTVASALDEGVSLADTTIKKGIQDSLFQQINSKRDEFSAKVDQLLAGRSPRPALDANAQASDEDLMPASNKAPQDVDTALDNIQRLKDAKDQSAGKFRTTDLDANITRILKDVRAQWPGYRDYIDEQGSRILGYNPANKVITDKLAQLNENTSNAQKQQEYWEKAVVNSGFSGSQAVLNTFRQDHDISKVENWMSKNNERIQSITEAKSAFELMDKDRANRQAAAEDLATKAAEHASTEFFMNRRLTQDSQTGAELSDKLTQLSISPNGRDPEAIRNVGTQLEGLAQRNYLETSMLLKNTKDKNGKSVYDTLGAKKVNEILDESIGRLYNTQRKLLSDNTLGLVFSTQNAVGDIQNNAALKVLNDPTTGGIARTAAALNKLAPNLSPDLVKTVWGTTPDFTDKLLNLSQEQMKRGLSQTGGTYDGGQGKIYTFKQFQQEQDKAQGMVHESDQQKAEATKNFMGLRKAFTEKDPRAVDAAITTFFDPSNRGTLNKYMDDYYDNSRGVVVKGRTGAFQDLTSDDITKAVWNRAHNGNGTAWEFYKSWARGEAVPALTTIAKTWGVNEEQVAKNKVIHGAEGDIPSGTDHHFYWNSDTHQIGLTDLKGNPISEDSWRFSPDIMAVRNANIMLKSLGNIAKQEGTEPNAFAFKVLKDAGWAPPSLDVRGKSTVSDRIIKAIVTSQTPPKKEGE